MSPTEPSEGRASDRGVNSGMSGQSAISDTTYAELRAITERYPQPRSGLLPMLHLIQSVQGCVTPTGVAACAEILGITPAEVQAVASFYSMYKPEPVGEHLVGVCTNTLCAVMGGDAIWDRLSQSLDVGNGQTTADGKVTLERVECNAACDYAPVVMVNWEFVDNQTPASAEALVDDLRSGRPVRSSRGPVIGTWRDTERVLAGFPDDKADDGPSAGEPSLAGLRAGANPTETDAPGGVA